MTMWGVGERDMECGVHTDAEGTASKIFQDEQLRVEVSDNLLDSGAGVRLYDKEGRPRALWLENGAVNRA